MSKRLELMAAVYPSREQAETILKMLQQMHRGSTINLADAAMVTRSEDGTIDIRETHELTAGKGAKRGAMIAGVFGLIFPPSLIASALVGGGVGAIAGKLRDTGIKTDSLKEIADGLEGGKSAVIALSEPRWVPRIERALQGWDGQLVRHGFNAEEAKVIEEAAGAADVAGGD
jgi:uncharacterized membrane protein